MDSLVYVHEYVSELEKWLYLCVLVSMMNRS